MDDHAYTHTHTHTHTHTPVSADVPPLRITLIRGSPRVIEDTVEAEFVVSRPVAGVRCFLRYEHHRDYKYCKK